MKFTVKEWARLLGRELPVSEEQVVVIGNGKNVLRVGKDVWRQLFRGWDGMAFRKGKEAELVQAGAGGAKADLPGWLRDRLDIQPGEAPCITRRGSKFLVKKLVMQQVASQVPGCIVRDTFDQRSVRRAFSLLVDLAEITSARLDAMLSTVGRFRRDPVAPLQRSDGRVGLLARKELSGSWDKSDREQASARRKALANDQSPDGSWQESAAATAFALLRLLEMGATKRSPAVARGGEWLLSSAEPVGFPGLFMVTQAAAEKFKTWKHEHGGKDRYSRGPGKAEARLFEDNVAVSGSVACELRIASTSAVVLEALLRLGYLGHPRVAEAVQTLLALRGARWCACGWFVADVVVPIPDRKLDFNTPATPAKGKAEMLGWPISPDLIHWPSSDRDVLKMTSDCRLEQGGHKRYRSCSCGDSGAVVLRESDGGSGNCAFSISRGLSWHPDFPGSKLEALAAIECEGRQSWDGSWGTNSLAMMFSLLERFTCPMSRFVLLRSVPYLIRRQGRDGLWSEAADVRGFGLGDGDDAAAQTSLAIVRALKKTPAARRAIARVRRDLSREPVQLGER